jgi:hypothetical protein
MNSNWTRWSDEHPVPDTSVEVITETGMQASYYYHRGLLFLPDRSMYAYVQPEFWRYVEGTGQ